MPKLLLFATLFFLVGLGLIIAGMINFVPVGLMPLGSILVFIALGLRAFSMLKR